MTQKKEQNWQIQDRIERIITQEKEQIWHIQDRIERIVTQEKEQNWQIQDRIERIVTQEKEQIWHIQDRIERIVIRKRKNRIDRFKIELRESWHKRKNRMDIFKIELRELWLKRKNRIDRFKIELRESWHKRNNIIDRFKIGLRESAQSNPPHVDTRHTEKRGDAADQLYNSGDKPAQRFCKRLATWTLVLNALRSITSSPYHSRSCADSHSLSRHTTDARIGREPGPGLGMFSAKFFSLSFPDNVYRGPSQVCNDHSQLGAFRPQGAKTPLFGPKIRYIQILCHCDVKNIHRNTIFGRKQL